MSEPQGWSDLGPLGDLVPPWHGVAPIPPMIDLVIVPPPSPNESQRSEG